ncbi:MULTISPECIES: tetratricopeptide repeat protein [unclassified Nocardiopsis]|uniref:tetratricopeptide repeat protein n=1 Tax=unclassified Nocardiopsis TaxID=2649073 RepID=UPI00135A83A2|nr:MULTISPECIES: tetratricopeptide repeat protein [unclassified Nocardiopsis]
MTPPPLSPEDTPAVRLVRNLVVHDRDGSVLLTAHPGPHWTPGLAAALWQLPLQEAQERLDRLAQLDVLTTHDDGRYTMDGEMRAALERTGATVLLPGYRRARSRVVAYYTEHAIAADLAVDPGRWRWHPPVVEQVRLSTGGRFASRAQALAWFAGEAANLYAVADLAHRTAHHQQTVLIAEAVGAWDELQRPRGTRGIIELGLASAESLDDDGSQAVMHHAMASWDLARGEDDTALACANYALALWSRQETRRAHPYHERGLAHLYLALSQAYDQAHHLFMAARYAELALQVSDELNRRDTALARYRQALALAANEHLHEAVALLNSALPPLVEADEQVWAARVHRALCEALMDLGKYEAAREHGQTALGLLRQEEAPIVCGQVHESLAWLAHGQGDFDRARDHFEQAWACYAPVDPPRALQMLSASREFTRPST